MPKLSPSLQLLEENLFSLLFPAFPSATISPVHPRKRTNLDSGEFLLIINYVSDGIEGSTVTNRILHPRISFTVYALNFPSARKFHEDLVDFLDNLSGLDFQWTDQKVDVVHRLSRTPISFDDDSFLYFINVDYRFILSSC